MDSAAAKTRARLLFQFVEGAGGGETFEGSLVDFARIEFCRKFTDVAEGAPGRLGHCGSHGAYVDLRERARMRLADALDRRERVANRRFAV